MNNQPLRELTHTEAEFLHDRIDRLTSKIVHLEYLLKLVSEHSGITIQKEALKPAKASNTPGDIPW